MIVTSEVKPPVKMKPTRAWAVVYQTGTLVDMSMKRSELPLYRGERLAVVEVREVEAKKARRKAVAKSRRKSRA